MPESLEVRPLDTESAKPAKAAPEQRSSAEPPSAPPVSATPRDAAQRLRHLQAASDVIIAIAVVLAICYVARVVLVVILVSILLAFVLAPAVEFLRRLRVPRGVGAALAVVVLLAATYGMTYLFYSRAVSFAQELPRYEGEIRKVVNHVRKQAEHIQQTTERVLPESAEDKKAIRVQPSGYWATLISSAGSLTEIVFTLSFIPFLVYFMLTWQEHVRAASVMLFNMEHRNTAYVTLGLISSMIRRFIVGNLAVGVVVGTVSTIIFGIMGLPYFYFIGYISGFLSLVPYLGVLLAVVPPVLAGIGHIHSAQMFLAIGFTVLGLHLFALNVLYPKFLGSRLQLNPLVVTLALLIWGWLWGAMGLILAIPITAATKIIFDHVEGLRPYAAWLGE